MACLKETWTGSTLSGSMMFAAAKILPGYLFYILSDLLNYASFEFFSSKFPISTATNESTSNPLSPGGTASSLTASNMFYRMLALGLTSQVVTKFLIFPFETVLARWWGGFPGSFLECAKSIWQTSGVLGFFPGFDETFIWEVVLGLVILEGSWYCTQYVERRIRKSKKSD
jgi:hypothetical protein